MHITDIIERKKHGQRLSAEELEFVASGAGDGSIPDYQLAAWLMAVWFNGMTVEETAEFTVAMAHSGTMNDLSSIEGVKADKHSTGGVGDKTSFIVGPVAACCGLKIAKMSGRGLGHTGGTIDKFESIDGLTTSFAPERFCEIVNKNGLCIGSQTGRVVPADKKLYALRDVTATIDCIPLIASSVMSKKLAGGADIIVLDVKFGSGSFMPTKESAEKLARLMVNIGKQAGKKCTALITDMNAPLGHEVGNLTEVREAVSVLRGECGGDLLEVCLSLVTGMLMCAGRGRDEARREAENAIKSGAALQKFADTVELQGGRKEWILRPELIPKAAFDLEVKAAGTGYLQSMDTKLIGRSSMLLGAGRAQLGDSIDRLAGITVISKPGDLIEEGKPVAVLHTSDPSLFGEAERIYQSALKLGSEKPLPNPCVYMTI